MSSVHLMPFGDIPAPLSLQIAQCIENGLGTCVQRHLPKPLPETTYDVARGQYHATHLLEHLESHSSSFQDPVIGLTKEDLFIPILTFVFGEARLNKPAAVLSLYRLTPQLYGLPKNDPLMTQRAIIEALHELGHTFGLLHCDQYPCAMHASRTADDIDLKSPSFCATCAQQLRHQNLSPHICT